MASQPDIQPDVPAPSQPAQPTQAPPELSPLGPDYDQPAPTTTPGIPGETPVQPMGF